jgi:glycosyltransferase involved in cell wall biosynthesis
MAPRGVDLAFVTSIPQTFGQNPWVIEIEDATTLFFPFLPNGATAEVELEKSPYFGMVRALLESKNCRGILTHMKSTADSIPTLFRSEVIARKVMYAPLGAKLPKRWNPQTDDGTINLLFTNSWHQQGVGFYLRGGLDVLEAFQILHTRYPQLRLTIRSGLSRLDLRHRRIIERCWVRVIDRFVPADEMTELQEQSHIYLLPSARIHIVSVLQAMSYGQAVVVSDGWGMDEYVDHGRNGLIVPGRAGKVSWMDKQTGLLRENYAPMYVPDPVVINGLVDAVARLVEDGTLRRQIGQTARADVESRFTLDQWNAALKSVFDKARAAA